MTIEQKQCLLKYLGYYTGNIDGLWGQQSTHATAGFQDDYALKSSGVFDEETEEIIKKAVAGLADPVPSSDPIDFWDEIKHFKREEFRCKCGGKYCEGFPKEPQKKLVATADRVREYFGKPVIVSSGVRCDKHNANVGGVTNSRHRLGKAMDFCVKGKTSSQVLAYVQKLPEIRYAYAIDRKYVHMDIE